MYIYIYICIHICVHTVYILCVHMADSQIVYTEMVAERKTEEIIPYGSKKHRDYKSKNIPPCVRIASDPPCFYCSLPSAWKGGCAQSGFQGYALGYA